MQDDVRNANYFVPLAAGFVLGFAQTCLFRVGATATGWVITLAGGLIFGVMSVWVILLWFTIAATWAGAMVGLLVAFLVAHVGDRRTTRALGNRRDFDQETGEFIGSRRSALSTTLDSSRARVIGPTPPGFGEIQPATS